MVPPSSAFLNSTYFEAPGPPVPKLVPVIFNTDLVPAEIVVVEIPVMVG